MVMKVSDQKMAANRSNARLSTGPKSSTGKQKSKLNATKHGVYATSPVIWGEDQGLYDSIKLEQYKTFHPKTFIEKALVDQLVNELWTLKRLARAEQGYLSEQQRERNMIAPPELNPKEKEFMKDATWSGNKSAVKVEDMVRGESGPNEAQEKMLSRVKKKAANLPALYELAFLSDHSGKMQRLAALKRHTVQTILSLEQELERRLRKRRKSPSSKSDRGVSQTW
jgi:hypothetical protein